jgi:hypothetical protein
MSDERMSLVCAPDGRVVIVMSTHMRGKDRLVLQACRCRVCPRCSAFRSRYTTEHHRRRRNIGTRLVPARITR